MPHDGVNLSAQEAKVSQHEAVPSKVSAQLSPSGDKTHRALVVKLLLTVIGMFCFAIFLLPPLYTVFCDITGLNGKYDTTGRTPVQLSANTATTTRTVTVQFIADTNPETPWPFYPKTRSVIISPGQIKNVFFRVENPNNTAVISQAIPSISPPQAIPYLKKTQCFCFDQQPLSPFEGKDLGLVFYLDPELPDDIHEITLSYRLYDITERTPSSIDKTDSSIPTSITSVQQPAPARSKGVPPNA